MVNKDNISPIEQFVIDFVRELRHQRGATQDDIGAILDVSRSFVGDIESTHRGAKYTMKHINILADHFDLSPRDFFPEKPIVEKPTQRKTKK